MKASKETMENISNELELIKNAVGGDMDKDLAILIVDNIKDRDIDNCITIGTPWELAKLILGLLENNPEIYKAIEFINKSANDGK